VRTPCRGCGAEASRCREALPECRRIAADRRQIWATVNGFASAADLAALEQARAIEEAVARATGLLRAEIARLEAEVRRLQAEATVPGRRGRT
jgi:cell division protein FtsB